MEIYGVPQEPPSDDVVRALDVRAVGLVFVLASLITLPQSLATFVQMVLIDDYAMPADMLVLLSSLVAFNVLQVITGLAIAWQWPTRRVVFAAMVAVSVLAVAVAGYEMRSELGVRPTIAVIIEILGTPILVVLAPRWFDLRRLSAANAVGGVLIGYGIVGWINEPIQAFDQARSFAKFHADVGTWLWSGASFAISLAVATIGWIAGSKMARRQPARRALLAYVILALAAPALLDAISLIVQVGHDDNRVRVFMVSSTLIGLAVGVIRPLVLWFYAKHETEGHPVDGALPWIALWFAPHLLARCLLWEELAIYAGDTLGFVLLAACLALGVVLILAARDALRDAATSGPWLVATAFAVVLMGLAIYLTHKGENRYAMIQGAAVYPVTLLFATTATAAWLRRGVTGSTMRAAVRG